MTSSAKVRTGLFIVATGLALTVLSAPLGTRLLDEGYILYNSWRLASGAVPYRDFFMLYPPGMFMLLGGLMRLVGATVWVGRVTVVVCALLVALLVHALSRRFTDHGSALAYAGISLLWGVPLYNSPFPNWYALPLLMGALWVASREDVSPFPDAVLVGGLVGIAAMVKQSIGVLAAGAFFVLLLMVFGANDRRRAVIAYLVGLVFPATLIGLWLFSRGVFGQFVSDVVMFPLNHRADIVATVLPDLSVAGFLELLVLIAAVAFAVLPQTLEVRAAALDSPRLRGIGFVAIAALVGAVALMVGWRRVLEVISGGGWTLAFYGSTLVILVAIARLIQQRPVGQERTAVLGSVLIAGVMFLEAGGALDWSHLLYVIPPTLVACAWLFAGSEDRKVLAALGGLLAIGMAGGAAASAILDAPQGGTATLTGSMAGVITSRAEAQVLESVAGELQRVPRNAPVLVYPVDAGLYFMAQRRTSTRHAQYVHRLTSAELAEEVERLAADPPRVVVERIPVAGEEIGYARWSEYGAPVLKASIRDLTGSRRIGDFVVHTESR